MSTDTGSPTLEDNQASYSQYDDPLFLSSHDQPFLQIVKTPFDGHNFLMWKREVLMALAAKNKDEFINDTCPKPAVHDKRYSQWVRCDLMVLKWILNALSKPIHDSLIYVSSSKELWLEIVDRYGQSNCLELYQLKKDLNSITQDNSPIVDYYSKLRSTWEDIDAIDPVPLCTCGAMSTCSCSFLKRLMDRETQSKIIQLLMGLNSSYEQPRSHLLTMDFLPSLSKVLGLLQKVERQKTITDAADSLSMAHSAIGNPPLPRHLSAPISARHNQQSPHSHFKECTHCNRKGHSIDTCYKLQVCSLCHAHGHVAQHCFKRKQFPVQKSKGRPYSSFPKGQHHGFNRMANNVDVPSLVLDESPLDGYSSSVPSKSSGNDPVVDDLVDTVVQRVMKAIGGPSSHASVAAPHSNSHSSGYFK